MFEVSEALVSDLDVRCRDLGGRLRQSVQEDHKAAGAPVEDAIEGASVVAAKFPQLPVHLASYAEREDQAAQSCRAR